ncbi:hypothetical protein [Arthrobacter sp. D5-1]|uniref:hypothetical protein n=1 Tax=Micrococcaceae TaxID=1268 RepID=UPI001A99179C|nr:hypothetical protein [Arthrobacter sp. D5-1]
MGFWNLLNKRGTRGEPLAGTVAAAEPAPLSLAEQADLDGALVELNLALSESNVTSLRACSRNGRHWGEDPEAIRAIAATIRGVTQEAAQGLPDGPAPKEG